MLTSFDRRAPIPATAGAVQSVTGYSVRTELTLKARGGTEVAPAAAPAHAQSRPHPRCHPPPALLVPQECLGRGIPREEARYHRNPYPKRLKGFKADVQGFFRGARTGAHTDVWGLRDDGGGGSTAALPGSDAGGRRSGAAEGLDLSWAVARLLAAVLREAAGAGRAAPLAAPAGGGDELPSESFFAARGDAGLVIAICGFRSRLPPRLPGCSLSGPCPSPPVSVRPRQERMSERGNFLLRLLYYPAADPSAVPSADPQPEAGEWGISAHTDFELFTIMHQSAPGLEASGRFLIGVMRILLCVAATIVCHREAPVSWHFRFRRRSA